MTEDEIKKLILDSMVSFWTYGISAIEANESGVRLVHCDELYNILKEHQ